ncbi:MAG: type II secretion system protein N [Gammaproteobacteria bacterium]|jgi:hypothetical protein|nr:type II secretion system protein N [Gammaproteobacteria bacterium]
MTLHRKLALAGLALLLAFVIMLFPARTAFGWFAPAGVSAFGIEGTVWRGRARIINAGGLQLRNTEWDLSVLRLFTGRLAGDINTRWSGGFLEGYGALGIGGAISLRDATLNIDVGMLEGLVGIGDIGGQLAARLVELELIDNWPVRLIGTGEIRDLSSALMGQGVPQTVGSIGFEFDTTTETARDVVTGQLRDIGGPLELSGTLVLTPPGDYDLKTRIKARPNAPPALQNNLSFLGPAEPDGTRFFQLAGSI